MDQTQTADTWNRNSAQMILYNHLNKYNDDHSESDITYPNGLSVKVDIAFPCFVSKARKHSCQSAFLFHTGLHTPLHIE